ncbi:DNA-binding protein [Clostridium tetani]|uniref:phage terminase small subunit n=3 Tax=Clostridium tetani TaxID=1513 RepID=UPI002954B528|nr:phage terminase small subunit [Clostridium tetani]BDR73347.1 DNA-binding protein [Clostridium tetani]
MARARSPNRDKAFMIYKERDGNITNREIANILNISEKTVGGWKCKDKWNNKLNGVLQKNKRSTPKEKLNKGGQPNNKNAVGHGAPAGNKNAETHGFFSRYLPEETLEVIKEIQEKDPLDILWENITIQYAAIIRAQRIMHVKDKEDTTKVLTSETNGDTSSSERYTVQFAWDKHAIFLQAQSRAMKTLESMIKQYDELSNSSLTTEEQRLRIEKLKIEVSKLNGDNKDDQKGNLGKLIEVFKKGPAK